MKKMYKQPIVEHTEMLPQSIICASVGNGGTTSELDPSSSNTIEND